MVNEQTKVRAREWNAQNSLGFWDANRLPNPDQKTRMSDSYQGKKRERKVLIPCRRTTKAVEHESKGDTNWNGRPWNKEQEIGGRIKTIQITTSIVSTRIQWRVLETWIDFCNSDRLLLLMRETRKMYNNN